MYCTVNTPRADMSKLLGSVLEEGDVIFAHVRGGTKSVTVPSWGPIGTVLGDNGAGAVYIRRIKEESVLVSQLCFVFVLHLPRGNSWSVLVVLDKTALNFQICSNAIVDLLLHCSLAIFRRDT